MRKILSSLACVGFFSVFANANIISADMTFFGINTNDQDGLNIEKETVKSWNLKAIKFKKEDDVSPLVGFLRVGGRDFKSGVETRHDKFDLKLQYIDYDVLFGYGFYTQNDFSKTNINFLVGFHGADLVVKDNIEGKNRKNHENIEAVKFGVSTLTTFGNELVLNVDAFVKGYINDTSKVMSFIDQEQNVRFEINGMLGYKFGQDKDGFVLGFKCGYHNDLVDKGEHFGVSLGYIF